MSDAHTPVPLPFPFPRPWFPKLPERASMDFTALVELINAQPAEAQVWQAVAAVDAARRDGRLEGFGADLAHRPSADAVAEALRDHPQLADALAASFGDLEQAGALLHPIYLALDWHLLHPPSP